MRALSLYLLTLALCCFLKKGYCVNKYTYEDFKSNDDIMPWVEQYKKTVTGREVYEKLKDDGFDVNEKTVYNWLAQFEKERKAGGSLNTIRNETIEKSIAEARQRLYERQYAETMKSVPGSSSHYGSAMPSQQAPMPNTSLAFPNQPSNQSAQLNSSTNVVPFQKRESKGSKLISFGSTAHLPNQSQSTEFWNFSNPAPLIQAHQIARQSSNFTSGNPGSSTSASNKGKSININFSKNSGNWPLSSITGSSSHYGGAIPFQQAPMPGTLFPAFSNQSAQLNSSTSFVPSPTGTHSTIFFGRNSQNNEGMFNTRKPSSEKKKGKSRETRVVHTDQ